MKNYDQEQSELLNSILNNTFFNNWKCKQNTGKLTLSFNIQTYLACGYSNLSNTSSEYDILLNIDLLFNWIIKNKLYIPAIEFVSTNFITDQYTIYILDKIMKYSEFFKKVNIITNGEFLQSLDDTIIVQNKIQKLLLHNITTTFYFNNSLINESLFIFSTFNNCYYNFQLTPQNIDNSIITYQQLINQCDIYNLDPEAFINISVNKISYWDENKKQNLYNFLYFYIQLQDNIIDTILNSHNNLLNFIYESKNCNLQQTLNINIDKLILLPCQGLNYNQYSFGKFIIKNQEITDIKANNVELAIRFYCSDNKLSEIWCDTCNYVYFCSQCCFCQCFQEQKDPFLPVYHTCDIEKYRIRSTISIYEKLNILEQIKQYNKFDKQKEIFFKFINSIQGDYNK